MRTSSTIECRRRKFLIRRQSRDVDRNEMVNFFSYSRKIKNYDNVARLG